LREVKMNELAVKGIEGSARSAYLYASFLAKYQGATRRGYEGDLGAFARYIQVDSGDAAARLLCSLSVGEANMIVGAYRAALVERGLSPSSVNRPLAALRSLVRQARRVGLVEWTLDVEGLKGQAYRDTAGPGREAVRGMIQAATARGGAKGMRDSAILHLLYDLALRRGEVTSLDLAHVDLAAGTVAVLGKGRTQREKLSLPAPTKAALAAWLTRRGDAPGPLFVGLGRGNSGGRLTGTAVYQIVRAYGAAVGVRTRPHGLRHTAITEAVQAAPSVGIGLDEVRDFSRHADVATLLIYRDRARNCQGALAALVAGGQ